ncbi:MAG: polyketide synthase dehydratase domain-containing protein [Candidatus Obscuribacterales bacterium]|nr:polyketide synthase dehydratase domain-containing protein [Candidatus Obscuribacterales bacterium]
MEKQHLIIGLSCSLPALPSIGDFVSKYFAPKELQLLESGRSTFSRDLPMPEMLVRSAESAFFDAGLQKIPRNTAIFLTGSELLLQSLDSLSAILEDHFRAFFGCNLSIIGSRDSKSALAEAIDCLNRSECDYAMVLAASQDPEKEQIFTAAVLLAAAAAEAKTSRIYARIDARKINLHSSADSGIFDPCSLAFMEIVSGGTFSAARVQEYFGNAASAAASESASYLRRSDNICLLSTVAREAADEQDLLLPILGLISLSLALHLRVIPGTKFPGLNLSSAKSFSQVLEARPWIHPVAPFEIPEARRCGLLFESEFMLLSEHGSDTDDGFLRQLKKQSSELFIFSAATEDSLLVKLKTYLNNLSSGSFLPLHELACFNNCAGESPAPFRLAIITRSESELKDFLKEAIAHLSANGEQPLLPAQMQSRGVYYLGKKSEKNGKLAFVLPGLGAAYPRMLEDLCFYFPELRRVFDFVERLALKANDKVIPSRAVFPLTGSSSPSLSSQAMLATMDSAVITLLLAEWAIYALLKKLGVLPDVLLGCSTGEFAALTMSDAVDIMSAAEIFYHLSTHVSRSIVPSELAALRSIRVAAPLESFEDLLKSLQGKVYVGADLSRTCVLLSGAKEAIEELCTILKKRKIDFLNLPIAIPYHTPLVSGKISETDADVQSLDMKSPRLEAWSCSSGSPYPASSREIRKISTDLFEKPIRLRSTIQKLYESGVRIFVEVGPKGGLLPYISETLSGLEQLSVAANLQSRSGLEQLHVLLALLSLHGVDMKLRALYQHRVDLRNLDQIEPADEEELISVDMSSPNLLESIDSFLAPQAWELDSPEFGLAELSGGQDKEFSFTENLQDYATDDSLIAENGHFSQSLDNQNPSEPVPTQSRALLETPDPIVGDAVMLAYLQNMQQFHANLMQSQSEVLSAYLESSQLDDLAELKLPHEFAGSLPSSFLQESFGTSEDADEGYAGEPEPVYAFAFVSTEHLQQVGEHFLIPFSLSKKEHLFLLDHAIGGALSSQDDESRVYLLPLMVALEIMAEGAALLVPGLSLNKISEIRAYKRIRVTQDSLNLYLDLRLPTDETVDVRIFDAESNPASPVLLASCRVHFSQSDLLNPPALQFPAQDECEPSKLPPQGLYGNSVARMFHGPRMQSVCSIDSVSRRVIQGRLERRNSEFWFAGQAEGEQPALLIDPLLLDNASQFVLFQMYEKDLNVTALLPFHIDSIEFFDGYFEQFGDLLTARAYLRSMSLRGTEAQVELSDASGRVLARVNDVSSRAISLDPRISSFIEDPSRILCKRLNLEHCPERAIAFICKDDLPADETTLDWLSDYLLSPEEQVEWRSFTRSEKRRLDWLLGRIAARDAVRMLMAQEFGVKLKVADIKLRKSAAGYVEAFIDSKEDLKLAWIPQISISHSNAMAVGLAEHPESTRHAGIDLEPIVDRDAGFADLAFTESEKCFIAARPAEQQSKFSTELWTAKEAAAKSCGSGLEGNPKLFEMLSYDESRKEILILSRIDARGKGGIYRCLLDSKEIANSNLALVIDQLPASD